MGGSSSGGRGGSGGGGGNRRSTPKRKATPKAKKKDNGSSKYFKKTNTPNTPPPGRAPAPKPIAPRHRDAYVAPKAKPKAVVKPKTVAPVRPATPIKSKAVTKPLASPKIVSSPIPETKKVVAPKAPEVAKKPSSVASSITKPTGGSSPSAIAPPNTPPPGRAPAPKPVAPKAAAPIVPPRNRDAYVAPKAAAPIIKTAPKLPNTPPPGTPTPNPTPIDPNKNSNRSILFDPTSRDKFINDKAKGTIEGKAAAKAEADRNATKERINLSKDNKTVAEVPKYDQKYWADQLAKGKAAGNKNIQAELKAKQDSVGMKKAYSGDKVVTADMKRRASDGLNRVTGSMATLENGGVTKTEKKSGLLGEKLDTTYDYKGGPSIVTRANDPSLFGVNFGDKTSTTFVDGVEVATKTGRDPLGYDAKVTRPDIAGYIDDTQAVDPVQANEEIKSIDDQIKTETDPEKLKALHKRRLMLMRMNRTNTKFAGLLDDADTKRTNLMSIR